jgi:2-C-methyl-D-erythritol 4-phosphate cytidylyltransferase
LIDSVGDDAVGGILAVPVADTLKRASRASGMVADAVRIAATVPREGLWQAQTPQMFRYGLLMDALQCSVAEPDGRPAACNGQQALAQVVTDEASAVEMLGHAPRLVASSAHNLKVTYPADLPLAASILQYLFFGIPSEEQQ